MAELPRPLILQHGPLLPWLETELHSRYRLERLPAADNTAAQRDFLAQRGGQFTGLVTSAPFGASAALIEALPALQVISSFGVGLDKIDLPAAARRGIPVGYTPGVLDDCVADLALALLLNSARAVNAAERFVRAGQWAQGRFGLATRVSGKRLGIFGLGRIGRAIARRAAGFDLQIRYTNRSPVADVPYGFEPSLLDLARWCDFLVVAVAGGAGTRHAVSAEVLQALGPQGFLVNVSRGTVVDQEALVQMLVKRELGGAGLDVFEHEPQVPAELLGLDNVVVLPHIASGTHETRQDMASLTLANLDHFFAQGQVRAAAPLA